MEGGQCQLWKDVDVGNISRGHTQMVTRTKEEKPRQGKEESQECNPDDKGHTRIWPRELRLCIPGIIWIQENELDEDTRKEILGTIRSIHPIIYEIIKEGEEQGIRGDPGMEWSCRLRKERLDFLAERVEHLKKSRLRRH